MAEVKKVVFFVSLFVGILSTEIEHCNRHVSFGYGYKDFFALTNDIMHHTENATVAFQFYVKTSSDAHVLLTNEVGGDESIEIVIGGGSNSFSQIRMIRRNERKILVTEKTDKILSSVQFKKFDVLIDQDDIIAVKLEENIFLNWKLDNLFPIKYVAFGSWTNTKAEWRFACDSKKAALDKSSVPPPPLKRLKSHLLYLYDPNLVPVDAPKELHVKADLVIEKFNLDERNYEFTIRGMALLKWMDDKLKWKPDNYDGIQTVFLPSFQIWTPYLTVIDGPLHNNKPMLDTSASGVELTYEGSIFWRLPFEATYYCYVEERNYPNDLQNCTGRIGFWNEPQNLILTFEEKDEKMPSTQHTIVIEPYLQLLKPENSIENSKSWNTWKIARITVANERGEDCINGCGKISVILERSEKNVFGELIVAHIVVFFAFWFNNNHNKIMIYLLVLMFTIGNLFFKPRRFAFPQKNVPQFVIIYCLGIFLLLLAPVLYLLWTQINSHSRWPSLVRNGNNYDEMNRRRINVVLPRILYKYVLMSFHFIVMCYFLTTL